MIFIFIKNINLSEQNYYNL